MGFKHIFELHWLLDLGVGLDLGVCEWPIYPGFLSVFKYGISRGFWTILRRFQCRFFWSGSYNNLYGLGDGSLLLVHSITGPLNCRSHNERWLLAAGITRGCSQIQVFDFGCRGWPGIRRKNRWRETRFPLVGSLFLRSVCCHRRRSSSVFLRTLPDNPPTSSCPNLMASSKWCISPPVNYH